MHARVLALLLLASLGLPAAAGAAVPKSVKRVIADFRNDGRIDPCRHTPKAYRDTLKEVEADTEAYAPDFPIAVQAAREARVEADCQAEQEEAEEAEPDDGATASPTPTAPPATATPAPTQAPAPAVPVTPVTPVTPVDPPPSQATPAPSVTPTPEPTPEPTPAPTVAPGAGAGITPGVPPPITNKPDVVLTRSSDNSGARVPLAILAGLLAAALLAGTFALLMRRFGWGEERLAGVRHSWSEASYRTGGAWQDFTDWVRLGR